MSWKLRSGIVRIDFSIVLLLGCAFTFKGYAAHDDVSAHRDTTYQLGMKVFSDYCSRCHGEHADGRGKAAPLYIKLQQAHPSNFQLKFFSFRPKQYLINIVRDGGKKHSLSEYMPPFGGELSRSQIDNVVYFIQKVSVYTGSNTELKTLQAEK